MKLKNIVREIKEERVREIMLSGGHAAGDESARIMRRIVGSDRVFLRIMGSREEVHEDQWATKTMPEKLRDAFRKSAIMKRGSLVMIARESKEYYDSGLNHYLIDLNPAVPLQQAAIGEIRTKDHSNESFSLKKLYGINAPAVHWSQVAIEYRGKGYGATMYNMVLDHYGALQSDNVLYAGSLAMWTKHMPKVASFVGAMIKDFISDQRLVVPVTATELDNKKFLRETVGSIVAFKGAPPAALTRQLQAMQGLSLSKGTMQILQISAGIQDKEFSMEKITAANRDVPLIDFATYTEQQSAAGATLEEYVKEFSYGGAWGKDVYTGSLTVKFNKNAQLVIVILQDAIAFVGEGADGVDVWYYK